MPVSSIAGGPFPWIEISRTGRNFCLFQPAEPPADRAGSLERVDHSMVEPNLFLRQAAQLGVNPIQAFFAAVRVKLAREHLR